jgi:hypothetical protein
MTDQPQPPPVVEELTTEENIGVIDRLAGALALARTALSQEESGHTIFAVYGIVGELPQKQMFNNRDALCAFVNEQRAAQNADGHNRFLHMFCGQLWSLQKGRDWFIWDNEKFIPVAGGDVSKFIDGTGNMCERRNLDDVAPRPPEAEPAEAGDTPAADTPVVSGPREVGGETDPPG